MVFRVKVGLGPSRVGRVIGLLVRVHSWVCIVAVNAVLVMRMGIDSEVRSRGCSRKDRRCMQLKYVSVSTGRRSFSN